MTDKPRWVRVRHADDAEGGGEKWRERIDAEELEYEGPVGKFRVQGRELIVIFTCLIAFASIGYIIRNDAIADNKAHEAIQRNQRDLIEAIEVQNWILTIPQEKRPHLKRPLGANKYMIEPEG